MKQTKLESLLESLVNTASGFVVSLLVWSWIVVPVWKIPVSMGQNLAITALFTVVSVIRSYIWRRFFNAAIHKHLHRMLQQ